MRDERLDRLARMAADDHDAYVRYLERRAELGIADGLPRIVFIQDGSVVNVSSAVPDESDWGEGTRSVVARAIDIIDYGLVLYGVDASGYLSYDHDRDDFVAVVRGFTRDEEDAIRMALG